MNQNSQVLSVKDFTTCKGLKFVHINVRSLLPKIDLIRTDLLTSDIDILTISETWLRPSVPDGLIMANNYSLHRLDRSVNGNHKSSGGGICIYIKDGLQYTVTMFEHLNCSNEHIEFQFVQIAGANCKRILLINSYRPPSGNPDVGCELLTASLQKVNDLHKYEVVVVGDLNLDCSNSRYESCKKIDNFCNEFGLKNYIDIPTRTTANSSTILDVILTNIRNVNSWGVLNYNISDHNPVFLIKKRTKDIKNNEWIEGRSYKYYDRELLMRNLKDLDWSILPLLKDPNEAWEMIYKAILYEIDRMCPFRKFKINTLRPKWYTPELAEQAKERDRLARRARKLKTQESWEVFTRARNKFNLDIKNAKNKYTIEMLEQNEQNNNKFWKSIQDILHTRNNGTIENIVDPETGKLCEGVEAANAVNNFFNTLGSKISDSLPSIQKPYTTLNTECKLDNIPLITETEVINLINSISTNKSSCIDKLPARLLKDALLAIPKQITQLFNISLTTGIFPDAWKEGKITPIPKKGNTSNINNIRPITQTPIIGKLLERYVANHVKEYLEKNKLLYKGQGGFRQNHSTIKSIYSVVSDICIGKNNKEYTLAVFLDISKAFDSVNHKLLVEKIKDIGIGGNVLVWITNYLCKRKQYVMTGGKCSDKKQTLCGVPQGSVIGPLLFLIYVNDIAELNLRSKISLFADDTVIYFSGKDIDYISCQLQMDLDVISKWCCYNKLCLNVGKSKAMLFGNGYGACNAVCPDLTLCNGTIENVKSYNYLGIILDENMTFNDHVSKVIQNVNSKLHLLSLLRGQITCVCAVAVYKTMILPLIEYGNVFLTSCSDINLKRIQRLQNRGLRIALKRNFYAPVSRMHIDANILPVEYRVNLAIGKLMFTMKNSCNLLDMRQLSTRLHDEITYNVPFPNTERFKKSIVYRGPIVWNSLPPYLKSIENRSSFNVSLKSYFWDNFVSDINRTFMYY